jgi:hypothetical protein
MLAMFTLVFGMMIFTGDIILITIIHLVYFIIRQGTQGILTTIIINHTTDITANQNLKDTGLIDANIILSKNIVVDVQQWIDPTLSIEKNLN